MATSCDGGICYGHLRNETSKWYKDYTRFVSSGYSWFMLGGNHKSGINAGVFSSNYGEGSTRTSSSTSAVLISNK